MMFVAQKLAESAQFARHLLHPPEEIDFPTDAFARGGCGVWEDFTVVRCFGYLGLGVTVATEAWDAVKLLE